MLKNCKGFSLIEVLAALAVFSIAATATVPLLIHVYQDRAAVREEQKAMSILQNHLRRLAVNGIPASEKNEVTRETSAATYQLTRHFDTASQTIKACVSWTGSNERRKQKCGYAKIHRDSP